jgi:hypothetical protein
MINRGNGDNAGGAPAEPAAAVDAPGLIEPAVIEPESAGAAIQPVYRELPPRPELPPSDFDASGDPNVAKSIQEWMREGEDLYTSALKEFQDLEVQLVDLEQRMLAKQTEVNQLAQIIGKPPVEGNRRVTAQLIEEHGPHSVPNSSATIARALAGKTLNR